MACNAGHTTTTPLEPGKPGRHWRLRPLHEAAMEGVLEGDLCAGARVFDCFDWFKACKLGVSLSHGLGLTVSVVN